MSNLSVLEQYLKGTVTEGKAELMEVLTPDMIREWRDKPSTVRVETINECNGKCLFCGYPTMTSRRKPMSNKLFTKIINDCAEWRPNRVKPYLHGELFCDPKWKNRLSYIDKHLESEIHIETNGSLMDKEAVSFLLDLDNLRAVGINFSGPTPDKFNEIMGLDYNTVRENTINLLDQVRKNRKPIEVYTIMVTSADFHTVRDGQFYRNTWGPISRTNMYFNYGGSLGKAKRVHNESPCQGLNELCVLSNGKVSLCWLDLNGTEILGNARKDSLLDIWNTDRAIEIRQLHKEKRRVEIPICRGCNFA